MAELKPPIDLKELTTLISASDAKSVAESADLYHELSEIAYQINTAANTGSKSVRILHQISKDALDELEGQGYVVKPVSPIAIPNSQFDIFWE